MHTAAKNTENETRLAVVLTGSRFFNFSNPKQWQHPRNKQVLKGVPAFWERVQRAASLVQVSAMRHMRSSAFGELSAHSSKDLETCTL